MMSPERSADLTNEIRNHVRKRSTDAHVMWCDERGKKVKVINVHEFLGVFNKEAIQNVQFLYYIHDAIIFGMKISFF